MAGSMLSSSSFRLNVFGDNAGRRVKASNSLVIFESRSVAARISSTSPRAGWPGGKFSSSSSL